MCSRCCPNHDTLFGHVLRDHVEPGRKSGTLDHALGYLQICIRLRRHDFAIHVMYGRRGLRKFWNKGASAIFTGSSTSVPSTSSREHLWCCPSHTRFRRTQGCTGKTFLGDSLRFSCYLDC